MGRTLSFGGERSEAAFGEVPSHTSFGKKKPPQVTFNLILPLNHVIYTLLTAVIRKLVRSLNLRSVLMRLRCV